MRAAGYHACNACGSRQVNPGRCKRCYASETHHRPTAPLVWPCSGCGHLIWADELCEVCDTAQCPLCFSEQHGQCFGLGCPRCGFQPYGTLEQAEETYRLGAGAWPPQDLEERRPGD